MANLINNPGFETVSGVNPANWVTYTSCLSTEVCYPTFLYSSTIGRNSTSGVGITMPGITANRNANWEQNLPVGSIDPTKTYFLSGYISTNNIVVGQSGWAGAIIYIAWKNSTGGYLGASYVSPTDDGACINGACFITGTNVWKQIGSKVIPLVGTSYGTVAVGLANCSGTVYFDDLYLDIACPTPSTGFSVT